MHFCQQLEQSSKHPTHIICMVEKLVAKDYIIQVDATLNYDETRPSDLNNVQNL